MTEEEKQGLAVLALLGVAGASAAGHAVRRAARRAYLKGAGFLLEEGFRIFILGVHGTWLK